MAPCPQVSGPLFDRLCFRGELAACESRCEALRRVTQTLQTETLHLYSQIHLEAHSRPQDFR